MVRKHTMSSFLLSIKLETALVSGSDTGSVPQNVKSWQFLDAPIPGDHKERVMICLEPKKSKESSSLRAPESGLQA